jgi:uncharacterized protein affecting Mg2+/Co2+ transport
MAGIQAIDGTTNVTVVSGASYTGMYAVDGSMNVVQVDGTTRVGRQHACGATNAFKSTSTTGHQHPSGSMQVSKPGAFVEGTRKVTVVSGVLT